MPAYDAIVLGLGGMGSATLFHLARRGLRVLGLERFDLVHEYGSSHGLTRIIRLAYWEHPTYVALLRRAYELWRELESLAGERLLHITGSVDAGPEGGADLRAARSSRASSTAWRTRSWTATSCTGASPATVCPRRSGVSTSPRAGSSCPSAATWPTWSRRWPWARRCGAARRCSNGRRTAGACGCGRPGDATRPGASSSAPGPGPRSSSPSWRGLAVPERQVLAWLQPTRPDRFRPAAFPVFNLEVEEGRFYGFPSFLIPGFKFGKYHHRGENVDPDTVNRESRAGGRGAAPGLRAPLFPGGRRPHAHAQGLHVHQHPRPPLHPGPPPRPSGGLDRGRLLRPRLQVLQRDRRGDGGPGAGRARRGTTSGSSGWAGSAGLPSAPS